MQPGLFFGAVLTLLRSRVVERGKTWKDFGRCMRRLNANLEHLGISS